MSAWRGVLAQALPVVGVALLSSGLTLMALKLSGRLPGDAVGPSLAPSQVVVFDIIKYTNAQRAVASRLLSATESDRLEAGGVLLELSRRAREAIARVAGPERVVLVKQAVLQGSAPDITDTVLLDLGLPTDVATVSAADVLGDAAPTWLSLSGGRVSPAPAPKGASGNSGVLP